LRRFQDALEHAAKTGDWKLVYPCLAEDVEWNTPQRSLAGVERVEHDLNWGSPPEHLDLEFEVGEWIDLGGGRAAVDVDQTWLMRDFGEFAYRRKRRIEITIHDGKISRYEMKFIG